MNQSLKIKKPKTSKINLKILKYQVLGFLTKKSFWISLSIITLIGFIPTIVIIVSIFQIEKNQTFAFNVAISINSLIYGSLLKYCFGLFVLGSLVSKIFREDWNNGTLLILLSKPFHRISIFLQKLFALLAISLFNIIIFWFITNIPAIIFSFFVKNKGDDKDIFDDMIWKNFISLVGTIVFILTISPIFIVFAVSFKHMKFLLLPSLVLIGLQFLDTNTIFIKLILDNVNNELVSKIISYLNVFDHLNFLIIGIENNSNKDILDLNLFYNYFKYFNWYVVFGVYSFISIVLIYLAWLKFKNIDFD